MDKKPFATNGNSGVGVSNPASPNVEQSAEEDFSGLKYVDVGASTSPDEERPRPSGAKRRKAIRGFLILVTLALVVIGFFFWTMSGKKKIDLAVRDRSAQAAEGAPQKIDDVTAQAIAEVRAGAIPLPAPSPVAASTAEVAAALSSAPVTIPLGGTVADVKIAPAPNATGVSSNGEAAKLPEIVSGRNTESSIRCAPIRPTVAPPSKQPAAANDSARVPAARPLAAEKAVTLPPFGAMLPVRTLGAIYSLRQSLARLELTRDLRGQGWAMKKGTILIGQQQGSEVDRAY